jgi:hypothetical protein
MSARIRRFGAFGSSSGRGKAAGAVIACAVMLLAGCGGSDAADAGAPVIRGGTGDESSSATASPSESPTPSASASASASTTPSASASDSKSASASASTSATATPQGATVTVPLPANLKVVRFYATESPTPGVAGTMAPQYASTATALKRNAFTQTHLSFVGWRDDNFKYYENEATYAFDKDVNLIGVWRSPGTPFNIVAKLTALTSASVTFQAAPNLDGTPAAVRSYDVSLIRTPGMTVGVRKVTGPGTYDFAVQRDYPYQFIVEDQVSNEIVVTPSAMVNTITFNPNGGSGSLASQSASTATALTQNADAIKRSGYAFDGWATTPTGSMAYADGKSYPFTASATLYARWVAVVPVLTVTFNPNGGSGSLASQSASTAAALTLNAGAIKRSGYAFDGWATTPTGSMAYADGKSYPFTASATLYARWLPTKTVTFSANLGTGTMANQASHVATALTANDFKRKAYVFDGWATTATGKQAYPNGGSYPFTSDSMLYARWVCKPFAVTVNGAYGLGTTKASVNFETTSELPMTTVTAKTTTGGYSATITTPAISGVIYVKDLVKNTAYKFKVTATNTAGCSSTNPGEAPFRK